MCLKKHLPHKTIESIVILVLVIYPLFIAQASSLQLTSTSEYNQYVHNYINPETGNYTQLDKPIFPVLIENSQIQIGGNWTITCPLEADHNYHVYCYGAWVNTSSAAKTDYDIYVYDPAGTVESSHTEAAGFPEHLGSNRDDSIFTPKQSGNYSFTVKNDDRDSEGAQQATFMIIENLECNKWQTSFVEGKGAESTTSLHTCWSYEIVTNESKLEIYLKLPDTLDIYEARLYLMNDAQSPSINSFPLPWEAGLYGNQSGVVGGYNFENEGYRGIAYASCERKGQDMFLNYTSPNIGTNLYHLVLIGEEGSGDVEFMVKTDFSEATLQPAVAQGRVYPDNPAALSFAANSAPLVQANLSYTINNWVTAEILPMAISNRTCSATIPGQSAGTTVQYQVDAKDLLENHLATTGSYMVKKQPTLELNLAKGNITLGQNITITGILMPNDDASTVNLKIFSSNTTETFALPVLADGTFTASYQPASTGAWSVLADSPETQNLWSCNSSQLLVTVNEPPIYVKYSLFIIIGLVAASAAGGAVWFLKFRGK